MANPNKLKINWTVDSDSAFGRVLELLDRVPHAKRTAIETALVSFYFPEVAIQDLKQLTPADVWQLHRAVAELEARLKLYQNFLNGLDASLGSLAQTLPKVERAADAAFNVTRSLQTETTATTIEDDDDFDDGGI